MSNNQKNYTIAWAMQGGGALGSFQVGAYAAAQEAGFDGSIFSGISIGALNGAILAGNEPKNRLARLRSFWRAVSRPSFAFPLATEFNNIGQHYFGWMQAMMFGQPKFFTPRLVPPMFAWPGTENATSFYDTSALRSTIVEHVDFDLINRADSGVRLFLGAVKVRTGEMVFFDSDECTITPEHVMASAALPPAFPGVRIDGELYWDGAIHNNTALDVLVERIRHQHVHVFMPVLFSADGPEPRTVEEVQRRMMEIRFGSHSKHQIKRLREAHDLRLKLNKALRYADPALAAELESLWPAGRSHELRITDVAYNAPDYETSHNDADFSEHSLKRREDAGYQAMREKVADLLRDKQPQA